MNCCSGSLDACSLFFTQNYTYIYIPCINTVPCEYISKFIALCPFARLKDWRYHALALSRMATLAMRDMTSGWQDKVKNKSIQIQRQSLQATRLLARLFACLPDSSPLHVIHTRRSITNAPIHRLMHRVPKKHKLRLQKLPTPLFASVFLYSG